MTERLRALIQPSREPTLEERFRVALQLADDGLDIQRARLRREHPDLDDAQVEEALWTWVRSRPPVGAGCPGLRDASYRFRR